MRQMCYAQKNAHLYVKVGNMNIDSKYNVIQEMRREQMKRERENYYTEYRRGSERRNGGDWKEDNWFLSFRLRLLIAILLFFGFFLMEQKEVKIGNIGTLEIAEFIEGNILQKE